MYYVSQILYAQGYDVHYFDEDAVTWLGDGEAFDVADNAVGNQNIHEIAIYGASHGGGSVYCLSHYWNLNGGVGGLFEADVLFAAYVDAIRNVGIFTTDPEDRYPTAADFCINIYQTHNGGVAGLFGTSIPGAFNIHVSVPPFDTWGLLLDHGTMDDSVYIQQGIIEQLMLHVDR